jgi:hypothetical protein
VRRVDEDQFFQPNRRRLLVSASNI